MKQAVVCLIFLFLVLSFNPFKVWASAIGPVECAVDVVIEERLESQGAIKGIFANPVCVRGFLSCLRDTTDCAPYAGKKAKLSAKTNNDKLMLMQAESIKLGVSTGSSMGPQGAVPFEHWTVLYVEKNGEPIAKTELPSFDVEVFKSTSCN